MANGALKYFFLYMYNMFRTRNDCNDQRGPSNTFFLHRKQWSAVECRNLFCVNRSYMKSFSCQSCGITVCIHGRRTGSDSNGKLSLFAKESDLLLHYMRWLVLTAQVSFTQHRFSRLSFKTWLWVLNIWRSQFNYRMCLLLFFIMTTDLTNSIRKPCINVAIVKRVWHDWSI